LGLSNVASIKTDGTLWLWGTNEYGQLGNNNTTSMSSPIQTISGGTNWKQVSVGQRFSGAIKTDGTLWMWGSNSSGQMGDNTQGAGTNKSSPVQTVAAGTNWSQVTVSQGHAFATKTDGTLWVWGGNGQGQLGINSTGFRSSPVQTIAGGTNWKQVSAKLSTTAAIKSDGTLWLWGANASGQLGNGADIVNKSSPIQTVAGGTNWKQVSVGADHVVAVKTDGTLWTWGRNGDGQLGNGVDRLSYSSPIQTISGGTNWKQVSAGGSNVGHSAGIKNDGTLWIWGSSAQGQLGDNTRISKSSPVQTIAGGDNWKQIDLYPNGSIGVNFF
jgi:alpha-tubulin suppressor-like RCC1 family protein